MVQTMNESESLAERANELYWSASMTVDDIVEELGISRSALYSSIEPLPPGIVCVDCDERMVFSNRTMRDRGVAVCPDCGRMSSAEEPESDARQDVGDQGSKEEDRVVQDRVDDLMSGFRGWTEAVRSVPPQRLALVCGGAALGILAGALATAVLREQV